MSIIEIITLHFFFSLHFYTLLSLNFFQVFQVYPIQFPSLTITTWIFFEVDHA